MGSIAARGRHWSLQPLHVGRDDAGWLQPVLPYVRVWSMLGISPTGTIAPAGLR